ncbi:MAG TPA: EAL domain-containing protein, partial [Acidimicrobiales bacterium]|nr:EAL domain-containing protein [Acidimicrobiales bacterium]
DLGWAPTLIPAPLVHWLAALTALGTFMTIKVLEWFAVGKESSEERFRKLVEHSSDMIVVTDRRGLLTYLSPSFERLLGRPAGSFHHRPADELLHADDLNDLLRAGPASPGGPARREVRLLDAGGSWRWFEATVTDHLDEPSVGGMVANLHDITERKRAEDELRQAHELFRSAYDNAPIGMAITDLRGNVLSANPAYGRIVGIPCEQMSGRNVHEITHPNDRDQSLAQMRRLADGRTGQYRIEKRYVHPDGQVVWASVTVCAVRDSSGRPLYLIGQIEDVTERRALRERLAHAAIHDPLTDLPNRLLFMDRLEAALNRTHRTLRRTAVIFIDLDRFKLVNDSMGHAAGDRLLQVVAERLAQVIRPADTVARFGGDEFAVLCEEVGDESMARGLARRLSRTLEEPIEMPEGSAYITASFGIALSHGHEDIAADLLRYADIAMYQAKEAGRARIKVYEERGRSPVVDPLRLQGELHRALDEGQFLLFYQPIVELATGRLVAVEALVRWEHPERGLLHPGEFIAEAEQSNLILPLGEWILEEACRQNVSWAAERARLGLDPSEIAVSVNLSPRQVVEPGFAGQVTAAMSAVGIDPGKVWLEVTEGALAADLDTTVQALGELARSGVHLCIDDFGAGYASLGHLSNFPVTTLKVDRSFVAGLGQRPEDEAIVASVVELAKSLGLRCVAEGVEQADQLRRLRQFGCDHGQGYLLGVPLPADALGSTVSDDIRAWPTPMLAPAHAASRGSAPAALDG